MKLLLRFRHTDFHHSPSTVAVLQNSEGYGEVVLYLMEEEQQ